jgi:putative transposase
VAQKKALDTPVEERLKWIGPQFTAVSVTRQCVLANVPRSTYYYSPQDVESLENAELRKIIKEKFRKYPFFGFRKMTWWLRSKGYDVNHKRVERLMREEDLQSVLPGSHTSKPHPKHKIYPYLLRGVEIVKPDQVWCSDITYVSIPRGRMYLVAILDWYSRYVLAWEISNTPDALFCVDALERALGLGIPGIFNTDQGSQFTSDEFTDRLKSVGAQISMDGRGRAKDNPVIERLWRSVKYEDIYIRDYADAQELRVGLERYFDFYNTERPHETLGNRRPVDVYLGAKQNFGAPPLTPKGRREEEKKKEKEGEETISLA